MKRVRVARFGRLTPDGRRVMSVTFPKTVPVFHSADPTSHYAIGTATLEIRGRWLTADLELGRLYGPRTIKWVHGPFGFDEPVGWRVGFSLGDAVVYHEPNDGTTSFLSGEVRSISLTPVPAEERVPK